MIPTVKIDLGESYTTYTWKGKPITDIRAWARKRGEKLIRYKHIQKYFDPTVGHEIEETSHGLMPESFFTNLCFKGSEQFIKEGEEAP